VRLELLDVLPRQRPAMQAPPEDEIPTRYLENDAVIRLLRYLVTSLLGYGSAGAKQSQCMPAK
jgi:hypothetical protein